jgi:hypothetical protein
MAGSQALAFGELLVGGVLLTMGVSGKSVREVLAGEAKGIGPIGGGSTSSTVAYHPGAGTQTGTATPPLDRAGARQLRGTVDFEGTPVAAWIYPYLKYARLKGWKGTVTSGYRDRAEQADACAHTSGPCATPGQSNHQGKRFPRGAVDVTNAEELAQILSGLAGSLLKWAGSADPVHFSFPHGGSY